MFGVFGLTFIFIILQVFYLQNTLLNLSHKLQRFKDTSEMLYVIIGQDVDNSLGARLAARPAHVERLQLLRARTLSDCWPNPAIDSNDPGEAGFTGSVIIAEFDSLAAAQAWANADLILAAGVYQQVTVKPFKQVLP